MTGLPESLAEYICSNFHDFGLSSLRTITDISAIEDDML